MERLGWEHVFIFIAVICFFAWLAKRMQSKKIALFTCLIMVCVAGLRHGYIDTRAYRVGFEDLDISETLNINYIFSGDFIDSGFSLLSSVIKFFINDSQAYLFVLSLITVGCLFWGIVNRVSEMDLGIFLFIATGSYLDTMNGVRQCLVSSVLFLFLPRLIQEKKLWQYMIVVLVLSTIHSSALLFIPIYFIATKKAWSNYTWGLIGICLILYVFFNSGVGSILVEILEGTKYEESYGDMILTANTSVNVIRVIVAAVPVFFAFLFKDNVEKDSTTYNIAFNMSVVNLLVWIFATKVLYFYRLSIYFVPYMILLLCYELHAIKELKMRNFLTATAVVCYFSFHIYTLYVFGDAFFVGYLKY